MCSVCLKERSNIYFILLYIFGFSLLCFIIWRSSWRVSVFCVSSFGDFLDAFQIVFLVQLITPMQECLSNDRTYFWIVEFWSGLEYFSDEVILPASVDACAVPPSADLTRVILCATALQQKNQASKPGVNPIQWVSEIRTSGFRRFRKASGCWIVRISNNVW